MYFQQDTLHHTSIGYKVGFVRYFMEYPTKYLKKCPVVEHFAGDRLCNIPFVYLT